MTVNECYEQAVSLLPEKPEENADMERFALTWCNLLLAENLVYENICRRAKSLPEIEEIPKVFSKEEEIPFCDEFVRRVFPYGMARFVFRENDDIAGSHEFYQLYLNAISEATPLEVSEVEDIYRMGGE